MDMLDQHVTDIVLRWFTTDDARALLAATSGEDSQAALRRVATLEAELADASDDRASGLITREQLIRLTATWLPELECAKAEATRVLSGPVWAELVTEHPEEVWERFTLPRKRAVVAELFQITVGRSKKGRSAWDPDGVTVRHRGGERAATASDATTAA